MTVATHNPASGPTDGSGTAAAAVVDATKVYGDRDTGVRALAGVTVAIAAGRFTAIMGPSGSGKSTLLHCMAGLDRLTGGQAFIGGRDLAGMSDDELTVLRRQRVGFVFQAFNLLPTMTTSQNIELPFLLAGSSPDPGFRDQVVASVGLTDRLGHRPAELSGGQQQRVAVARALITRPDIVFADEPTGNLDSRSGADVLDLLRRAVDELGQSVAMVTHDPIAAARADTVVFLADGAVVDEMADPTAQRVLERMSGLGG